MVSESSNHSTSIEIKEVAETVKSASWSPRFYFLPIVGYWLLSFLYIGTVLSKSWFVFAESKNQTLTDGNFYSGQKLGLWKALEFNEDLSRVSKLTFGSSVDTEGKI